jgi:hypothetical protein
MRTAATLGREKALANFYSRAVGKPYQEILRSIIHGNFWPKFTPTITFYNVCGPISSHLLSTSHGPSWFELRDAGTFEPIIGVPGRSGIDTICTTVYLQFSIVLPALIFSAPASGQMRFLAPEVARTKTESKSISSLLRLNQGIHKSMPQTT